MNQEHPMQTWVEFNLTVQDSSPPLYPVIWVGEFDVAVLVNYCVHEDVMGLCGTFPITEPSVDGDRILRVPGLHIKRWLTEDDVTQILQLWNIDQDLLAYARG